MKPLLTFLLLVIMNVCFAQKQIIFFYTNDGARVASRESADYIQIFDEQNPDTKLYNITELYKSGKTKLIGKTRFSDVASYEGEVVSFFENGQRCAVNTYKSGNLVDEQYAFYPNGKSYTIKKYDREYDIKEGPSFLTVASYDSLGKAIVAEGNGYYIGYDSSFKKINEEGLLKKGKKTGEWIFRADSTFTRVETYKDGKFLSGKSTDIKGEIKYNTSQIERYPSFPGGPDVFTRYLSEFIKFPEVEKSKGITGTVIVQFYVEKNGTLSNITVLRSPTPAFGKEALRVISKSPDWIPGIQYGRPARLQCTQVVRFLP